MVTGQLKKVQFVKLVRKDIEKTNVLCILPERFNLKLKKMHKTPVSVQQTILSFVAEGGTV